MNDPKFDLKELRSGALPDPPSILGMVPVWIFVSLTGVANFKLIQPASLWNPFGVREFEFDLEQEYVVLGLPSKAYLAAPLKVTFPLPPPTFVIESSQFDLIEVGLTHLKLPSPYFTAPVESAFPFLRPVNWMSST